MTLRVLALALSLASAAHAQPFEVLSSPNPFPNRSLLRGVDGLSNALAWAVGDGFQNPGDPNRHFILRWDGAAWEQVSVPTHPDGDYLFGVSVAAEDLAWAAGLFSTGGLANPQILRWNGSAWTFESLPLETNAALFDVFALSPAEAWAVGEAGAEAPEPPLAFRWAGSAWERVAVPPVADRDNDFNAVHASSPDNVWAVGKARFFPGSTFIPLAMRWDGSAWTHVPLPGELFGILLDVVTFGPADTWVTLDPMAEGVSPRVLHWDGGAWTSYEVGIGSFAPISPTEIYGFSADTVYQWDGTAWGVYDVLEGLSAPAFRSTAGVFLDGTLWAAGRTIEPDDTFRTLVVRGVAESYQTTTSEPAVPVGPALALSAPTPNPTRGAARLTLTVAAAQGVRVEAFDALGRRVAVLHNGPLAAGAHTISFSSAGLPAGLYLVRATGAGGARATRRAVVTR